MFNAYYQDELRYLREVGPEFARANPEIARFLRDAGSDPDVERLLEGVAFLSGRIRQKLDDELPEFTANLMALLWPHYLRPIPSMTILELLPEMEGMQGPIVIDAGAEFASVPVDGTQCRYRSCRPVTLRPWVLREVRLETAAARPVRLILRLRSTTKAPLTNLGLDTVQFHLAGDPRTTFALYLLLAAHLEHLTVSDGSSRHDRPEQVLGKEAVTPAGFNRREAPLPYPERAFPGYQLLQAYLTCKEPFLFFDVKGLDREVHRLGLTDTLELAFTFNRRLDAFPLVAPDNIRLHCVPIVNLFDHAAEPIRLRHDRVEYLVQPSRSVIADRRHAEVYSVDRVFGVARTEELETREFPPFYSFSHTMDADPRGATYYQAHVRPNIQGGGACLGTDTYISFVVGGHAGKLPSEETISIDLTCTNRNLPDALRAGDISKPLDKSPPGVAFRNLTKPTSTICPPLGKQLHWRLISHMSLNYVSLTNAELFKELLRVYDFQGEHDAQKALAHARMLNGIQSVRSAPAERLVHGAPIRGTRVELELNEDNFAGEGDAHLFSTILDRFMALYATLNAYTQLQVRFTKSGREYFFAPRWGEQPVPAETRAS